MNIVSQPLVCIAVVTVLAVVAWVSLEGGNILMGEHVPYAESSHSVGLASHAQAVVRQLFFVALVAAILARAFSSSLVVRLVQILHGATAWLWQCLEVELASLLNDHLRRALRRGILQPQHYDAVV